MILFKGRPSVEYRLSVPPRKIDLCQDGKFMVSVEMADAENGSKTISMSFAPAEIEMMYRSLQRLRADPDPHAMDTKGWNAEKGWSDLQDFNAPREGDSVASAETPAA